MDINTNDAPVENSFFASSSLSPRWRKVLSFALHTVRTRRFKYSKEFILKRRKDRLEYQQLWKRHLLSLNPYPISNKKEEEEQESEEERKKLKQHVSSFSSEDKSKLEEFEKTFSINDIIFFRSLAENSIRIEINGYKEEDNNEGTYFQQNLSGWLGWALGSGEKERKKEREKESSFRFSDTFQLALETPLVTESIHIVIAIEVEKGTLVLQLNEKKEEEETKKARSLHSSAEVRKEAKKERINLLL